MLRLQKATVAEILRWAAQHPDVEVCGLVWASEAGQTVRPLRNVHSDPTKYYRVSPADLREAFDDMDREGGQPLAYYHSHPGGKPDPSEEDMLGALSPGMYYLIAYPHYLHHHDEDPVWRLSTWECLEPQILVESEYEVGP